MEEATVRASRLPVKRTAAHIYFFGYEGPDPEVCFQQWYPSVFVDEDLAGSPSFPTSEHYMMYRKALLFGDEAIAEKILAAKPFDQSKWDGSCDGIVERGNYLKFSQNPKLKAVLLDTGDRFIIEASPSDRIWGIGFDAEHAAGNENEWGANKFGEALMRVRSALAGI
ncbi:N-glycosidase [Lachnellula suecica]|uniref:N-glycosidase n=1 Tax=Lachnellula suecica TaxID=602035 RepID=A0A8T9BY94_9HELO|nr:N-glycosidase [Lachnellula suecica]